MKNYIAYNSIDSEYERFDTIEEAREYLEEIFLDSEDGYHPEMDSCKIYALKEVVKYDVVDKKENYKYLNEEDIPDDDDVSEAWPYDNAFDEIWRHKFVDVDKEGGV
jgi:hypothetical protein